MGWLGDFLSGLWVDADNAAAAADATAKLRRLNQQQQESGKLSWEEYYAREQRLAAGPDTTTPEAISGQLEEAFSEGLSEGYSNVTGAVKSVVNAPFRFAWDALPWWLWAGGLIFLAWRFGLLDKLIKKP